MINIGNIWYLETDVNRMLFCYCATHNKKKIELYRLQMFRESSPQEVYFLTYFLNTKWGAAPPNHHLRYCSDWEDEEMFGWCRAEQTDVTAEAETAYLHTYYLHFTFWSFVMLTYKIPRSTLNVHSKQPRFLFCFWRGRSQRSMS